MQEKIIEELRQELKEQIKENQELEKKVDGLVTVIDLVRRKIEGTRIYGLRSGKTLIATLLNDILEILERVNEE